ncbi:MAG: phage holin family protein [Bacteroidota bacterium]
MSAQPEPPKDQTLGQFLSGFRIEVKDYVQARIELAKSGMHEQMATRGGELGSYLVLMCTAMLFILFAFIGLGFWIGELLESNALGFTIVGGGFLFVLLLLSLFRNNISLAFAERIAQKILQTNPDQADTPTGSNSQNGPTA